MSSVSTSDVSPASGSSIITAGRGGAIQLETANGDIRTLDLLSGSSDEASISGTGGTINLAASGNITTASINTTSQFGSGNITITSNGAVSLGGIDIVEDLLIEGSKLTKGSSLPVIR